MTPEQLKSSIGRIVLDRGPHAVVVMDPAGRVRFINPRFSTISGWTAGEAEGLPMERLLWNGAGQLDEIWSRVGTGREWRGELSATTRGGDLYREHASITPVTGPNGRTVLLLLVSTPRDRAEKETRSRFEYLTDMSHELRTPIHAIIGNTELLSGTSLNEEQKDYTETVRLSADILLTLINDVLDFSKIESGRLELEKIPFDVHEVVEEAVDLVALQAHTKGLEIITRFSCVLSHLVEGDPLRLRQILVNLLNNAVKFTRAGEVEVSVSQERLEQDSVVLRFTVRDTGIGIPRDRQDSLFQAFSQIDTSITRTFGGTGLGLAISRRLAGLMGGAIGVHSEEGQGSTFWFTARLTRQGSSDKYAAVAPDFFGGVRVLVVDDNQTARSVLRDYLESWGCRVSEASEGAQALTSLRAAADSYDPFSIALIDLRLPGIDGWQLASKVTSDPAVNATRLVLMTPFGHGAQEAKMKLLKWFDAYLNKPVRKLQLFEAIFRFQSAGLDLDRTGTGAVEVRPGGGRAYEGVRVLVAEDNEVNQRLFLMMLAKMGCTTELAFDGGQAVQKALGAPFDIIFLDVRMPVMDGMEAARALRSANVSVPIIAVTASVSRSNEGACLEAGMNAFLPKPFRRGDLEGIFTRWLRSPLRPAESRDAERPESDGVFDYQAALAAFSGERETLLLVAAAFLARTAEKLPGMQRDLQAGQWGPLGFEAHAVKGGALGVRAAELAACAARLERAAGTRNREEGDRVFEEYRKAFTRLEERIHAGRAT